MPSNLPAPPDSTNITALDALADAHYALGAVVQLTNDWMPKAITAIESLASWQPPAEPDPPHISVPNITASAPPSFGAPNPTLFGVLPEFTNPEFMDLSGFIRDSDFIDPGAFTPTILPQQAPTTGPQITGSAPVAPPLQTLDVPDAPAMDMPRMDTLSDITIPAMPSITIPVFDVPPIPDVPTDVPNLALDWQEKPYDPLVVNDLTATIKRMLSGGFAMPEVVQDALLAAASDREDLVTRAAVEDAFDDWAARGFSMPPGMLAEQVNTTREQSVLRKATLSRDIFTKAAEWAIENLRQAVAQGIALESAWMSLWNNMAQRAFDAARLQVEIAKDYFNLKIAAFNLYVTYVQTKRDVFEAQLRGEMAKLDILKAEIEAEQLVGTLNEQKVRIYTAQVGALQTVAQVYTAKLEGVRVQADVQRIAVDKFKVLTDAWVSQNQMVFSAYDSRVRAIGVSGQIYSAEAQAYAAEVSGANARNDSFARLREAQLNALRASVEKYNALVAEESASITAARDAIQARAQSYSADVDYMSKQMQYATQAQDLQIRAQDATVRNNIAYFQTLSSQFESRMQRLLQGAAMMKDGMQAAASLVAQMVSGAMSTLHATYGITAGAHVQSSYGMNKSVDYSVQTDNPPLW